MSKIEFENIIALFGNDTSRQNFIYLCRSYYHERVSEEAVETAGVTRTSSRRSEFHNEIMGIVQKLFLSNGSIMPSRKDVGLMIMEYFRREI